MRVTPLRRTRKPGGGLALLLLLLALLALLLAACAPAAAPSEDERRLAQVQAALPFTLLVPTLPAGFSLEQAEVGPRAPDLPGPTVTLVYGSDAGTLTLYQYPLDADTGVGVPIGPNTRPLIVKGQSLTLMQDVNSRHVPFQSGQIGVILTVTVPPEALSDEALAQIVKSLLE